MEELIQLDKQEYTLIGKNSKHKGDFHFGGTTYISGLIEGNIILDPKHKLSIDVTGRVVGNISSGDINIKGHFSGEITSSGAVSIEPSAKVIGTISAKNLIVSPGASVSITGAIE